MIAPVVGMFALALVCTRRTDAFACTSRPRPVAAHSRHMSYVTHLPRFCGTTTGLHSPQWRAQLGQVFVDEPSAAPMTAEALQRSATSSLQCGRVLSYIIPLIRRTPWTGFSPKIAPSQPSEARVINREKASYARFISYKPRPRHKPSHCRCRGGPERSGGKNGGGTQEKDGRSSEGGRGRGGVGEGGGGTKTRQTSPTRRTCDAHIACCAPLTPCRYFYPATASR